MPEMELVDSMPAPEEPVAPSPEETVVEVTPTVEAPAPTEVTSEPVAVVEPTTPEPALFELPDGRKVDAATLEREWKQNFYPEFTRKSQELAALKTPITKEEPAWKNPDYSPTTWAEAIEIATQEAESRILNRAAEAETQAAAIRTEVETQMAAVKAIDPKVDEDALFAHATKYGFTDLKTAHTNFKAIQDAVLTTEQRVLKSQGKYQADPIATTPTAPAGAPKVEYSPSSNAQYRDASEFLAAIKGK